MVADALHIELRALHLVFRCVYGTRGLGHTLLPAAAQGLQLAGAGLHGGYHLRDLLGFEFVVLKFLLHLCELRFATFELPLRRRHVECTVCYKKTMCAGRALHHACQTRVERLYSRRHGTLAPLQFHDFGIHPCKAFFEAAHLVAQCDAFLRSLLLEAVELFAPQDKFYLCRGQLMAYSCYDLRPLVHLRPGGLYLLVFVRRHMPPIRQRSICQGCEQFPYAGHTRRKRLCGVLHLLHSTLGFGDAAQEPLLTGDLLAALAHSTPLGGYRFMYRGDLLFPRKFLFAAGLLFVSDLLG